MRHIYTEGFVIITCVLGGSQLQCVWVQMVCSHGFCVDAKESVEGASVFNLTEGTSALITVWTFLALYQT